MMHYLLCCLAAIVGLTCAKESFFSVVSGDADYSIHHESHGNQKFPSFGRSDTNGTSLAAPLVPQEQPPDYDPKIVAKVDSDSKIVVYVRNQCDETVRAAASFLKLKDGESLRKFRFTIVKPGQTKQIIKGLRQPEFWINGDSKSYSWVGGGNQRYCIRGLCFQYVKMEESFVGYTFSFHCISTTSTDSSLSAENPVPPPALPPTNGLSTDDTAWLDAHNTRRSRYHSQFGVSFKALKWSNELAESAKTYAELLAGANGQCYIAHRYQDNRYGGENLAANWGTASKAPSPDSVLRRWTEDEEHKSFKDSGHFAQVLWRGSLYVGCGVTVKLMANGLTCHIQACRYLAPGNCNVNEGNQKQKMLEDSSPCVPQCPLKEGCF